MFPSASAPNTIALKGALVGAEVFFSFLYHGPSICVIQP